MTLTIPRTTSTQPTARSTLILIPPQLNLTQHNSTSIQFNSFRWFILCCSLPFSVSSLQSLPCCPYDFPLSFSVSPKPLIPQTIALPIDCLWLAIAYSLCAFLLPISLHVYHKVISEFHKHTNINWNFLFIHFKRKEKSSFNRKKIKFEKILLLGFLSGISKDTRYWNLDYMNWYTRTDVQGLWY